MYTDIKRYNRQNLCLARHAKPPLAPWKRVDDVQASLPGKDRARVEREGNLLSRAEYEKYLNEVASRET